MPEIVNRVEGSNLIQINIEDLLPPINWKGLDIATFLEEGLILREKEFRANLKDWKVEEYKDSGVIMYCSTDAIFPEWVYLLLSLKLSEVTPFRYIGTKEEAQSQLLSETIQNHDYTQYHDQSLILKGCGQTMVNAQHLLSFFNHCLPYAKSIMYGEACAAVPVFKKSKD